MAEEQKTENQQVEEPKITIEDIVMVQRIIATASSRGAFRAEEMSSVGRVYDRVSAFVSHNAPEANKKPEADAEAEAEGQTEESGSSEG